MMKEEPIKTEAEVIIVKQVLTVEVREDEDIKGGMMMEEPIEAEGKVEEVLILAVKEVMKLRWQRARFQ